MPHCSSYDIFVVRKFCGLEFEHLLLAPFLQDNVTGLLIQSLSCRDSKARWVYHCQAGQRRSKQRYQPISFLSCLDQLLSNPCSTFLPVFDNNVIGTVYDECTHYWDQDSQEQH